MKVRKKKKPFKSGLLINTVKGIINHPILNVPAFVFYEDDSYVDCRKCIVVEDFANPETGTLITFNTQTHSLDYHSELNHT